jgi:CheY-like chemotaxis protein
MSLPPKSLVLYADDDYDDIELVKDSFKEYASNIELLTFDNGIAITNYIKNLDPLEPLPCLIILDINMPLKNGKDALKDIRSTVGFEEVPAVLFSTSTMPSDAAFAKAHNAGFLTKPLHADQIHQLIDQMIEHCTEETKRNIKRLRGEGKG